MDPPDGPSTTNAHSLLLAPKSHLHLLPPISSHCPSPSPRITYLVSWWAHGAAKKKQLQQQLHRRTPREHSPPSSPAALRATLTLTSTCDRERELGRGPPSPNPTAKQLPAARREDTHVVVTGDTLHRLQLLQVGAAPPRPVRLPFPAPRASATAGVRARLPLVPAPPFAHRLVVVVVARPPGYTKPTLLDRAARAVCMPARSPGTRVVARGVPPLSPLPPWLG